VDLWFLLPHPRVQIGPVAWPVSPTRENLLAAVMRHRRVTEAAIVRVYSQQIVRVLQHHMFP